MRNLTTHWPFNNYPVAAQVIDSSDAMLKEIAMDVYTRKTGWTESCYRSAAHFQNIGRTRDATTTYAALIEDYQHNYYAYYLLALLHKDAGNLEAATREYAASIAINPDYPFARVDYGLLQVNAGRFDDAIEQFRAADTMAATRTNNALRASVSYGLAAAYANKSEYTEALHYVEQSIALAPLYQPALELRLNLRHYLSQHPPQ